uniref:Uncharacterized protein n=1 Tax=Arundo donax TaxID=35708 RepID=A0A0A9HBF7_ARUDO
MESDSSLLL